MRDMNVENEGARSAEGELQGHCSMQSGEGAGLTEPQRFLLSSHDAAKMTCEDGRAMGGHAGQGL